MADPTPLTAPDLAALTQQARATGTVYVQLREDWPGIAEAGDLVHCVARIDGDGDLIVTPVRSAAFDPLPTDDEVPPLTHPLITEG